MHVRTFFLSIESSYTQQQQNCSLVFIRNLFLDKNYSFFLSRFCLNFSHGIVRACMCACVYAFVLDSHIIKIQWKFIKKIQLNSISATTTIQLSGIESQSRTKKNWEKNIKRTQSIDWSIVSIQCEQGAFWDRRTSTNTQRKKTTTSTSTTKDIIFYLRLQSEFRCGLFTKFMRLRR